jgi:hypothetical protein
MATMLSSGWGARRRRRRTEGIILGSWIARRRVVWCVVGHDFLLLRCLWRQPGGNPGHRTAERGMREKEERRGEKKTEARRKQQESNALWMEAPKRGEMTSPSPRYVVGTREKGNKCR